VFEKKSDGRSAGRAAPQGQVVPKNIGETKGEKGMNRDETKERKWSPGSERGNDQLEFRALRHDHEIQGGCAESATKRRVTLGQSLLILRGGGVVHEPHFELRRHV